MPFDRKKELDALEGEGPMPFAAAEEEAMDMEEMEMPEGEEGGETAYSPDEIRDLYSTNTEFAAKVDEFAPDFMDTEAEEEPAEEEGAEMPDDEEDLFA